MVIVVQVAEIVATKWWIELTIFAYFWCGRPLTNKHSASNDEFGTYGIYLINEGNFENRLAHQIANDVATLYIQKD